MDITHLSDEQIQNYLDHSDPDNRGEIETHLQHCLHCTRNLHIYQGIYQQLNQDTIPNLSKKFSGLVLTKIKTSQVEKTNFWENIIFIALVVLGAMVISYLSNPLPMLKSIVKPVLDVFASTLGKVPMQLNSTLILIAGGIIILIFYEFLNNRLLKSKS